MAVDGNFALKKAMEISQNLVQSMVGMPVLMFLEYLLVLIAVLADLVSGVR